jgi:glycosyltransferase involved in cell wall biosynthesis
MNDKTIPVSVIVPNYNSRRYLKECIESINSGQRPAEILIIDDCSTDDSLDLAFKLKSQYPNIKVLQREVNGGAAEARKLGVYAASQDLIALVDADDLLETDALADAYAVMMSSAADVCIWDLWSFDAENKWRHAANPNSLPKTGREAAILTLGGWRMHAAGMSLKSLYKKAYRELAETAFNADELLTRLVFSHATMIVGCQKKYLYRSHAASTTRVLSVRRLSSLDSCLWLLNFAHHYPEAPIRTMVRGGIAEAWFYWKNRNQIGKAETLSALREFLPKIARFPGLWSWLWQSPKHFIALLFLSGVILVVRKRRNEAHGVGHV